MAFKKTGSGSRMVIGSVGGNVVSNNYGTVIQSGNGSSSISFGAEQTITIEGKTYTGRKIEQRNGRVFVDDRDVTDEVGIASRQLNIVVQGNVESIDAHGCNQVAITGNVGRVKTTSGDVEVRGDVSGSIESVSGDVKCGKVGGGVKTVSGDIRVK